MISGGSKGGARDTPSRGPKFFQFHAVFGKIWQNRMLAPPGELAPPPRGNPGSATGDNYSNKHDLIGDSKSSLSGLPWLRINV